ncbi:MAG: PD-(D/E)XK nuclease family protein [Verrucomicrobia bacterium]|nr:PD-(D/E)XK nuclease family protein [Verrucomicrobiota bacterium]
MQPLLTREMALLQQICFFNRGAVSRVHDFIRDKYLSGLAGTYRDNLSHKDHELGFNLFELISDYYYRETFHSDILYALLNPNGKHQQKHLFCYLFLEFLKLHGARINLADYTEPEVTREIGRIDLLIVDQKSKKAIFVENKINNAADRRRQIPGYLDYVRSNGYYCDAIVYLRLIGCAGPATTDWTPQEAHEIKNLLKVICAYDSSHNDLLHGWLLKCAEQSTDLNVKYSICQYAEIIRKLGRNIMNKPVMEAFHQIMCQGDNFQTALALKAMVDDLASYRAHRIVDHFKNDLRPFGRIDIYSNRDAYFTECPWKDAHLGIDVWAEPDFYLFQFWDRNDRPQKNGRAAAMLEKMGRLDEFVFEKDFFRMKKNFIYPTEETLLFDYISAFKQDLWHIVKPS